MADKKKSPIIQLSFKDTELDLYYRIKVRCKLISMSGWIKEAIYEKLEREEKPQEYNTSIPTQIIQQYEFKSDLPVNGNGLENFLTMFK